jgi:hypothetical protein
MEPHGLSPWYLHEKPSYAPGRRTNLVRMRQGFGGLSTSGGIRRSSGPELYEGPGTSYAFIVRRHRL